MDTPSSILTLPSVEAAETLARHCVAVRAIGVITGPNGVGKTEALRALTRNPQLLPPQRTTYYHAAVQAEGASRGVRDILVGCEVRQAIHQRGLALPIALRLALREFQDRKIGLLLIDEADHLSLDALQGIISMFDYCQEKEHPMALICAGVKSIDKWIQGLGAAWSRTLKVSRVKNLTVELTCALFAGWGPPVSGLAEAVKKRDRDAIQAIKMIHAGTAGNLRRLFFFAGLAALNPKALTVERVRELMQEMTTAKADE